MAQPEAARATARAPGPEGAAAPAEGLLRLQREIGNRAVTALVDPPAPGATPPPPTTPLPLGSGRRTAFGDRAQQLGLSAVQADELWQAGGGPEEDGFAAAEQRTGALFSAAKTAQATGVPTFYVHLKVGDLAQLNKTLGHSGADEKLAAVRRAVAEALAPATGQLRALRDRASGFGFLATGSEARPLDQGSLAQAADTVASQVAERQGVTISSTVMDVDEAAASAVLADLAEDRRSGPSTPAKAPAPPSEARFTSSGTDRRRAFVALAASFGLAEPVALDLYGMLLESRPDALTGFERAADREATVAKAAEHARTTGTAAAYVELDVRNLGGLNRDLGRRGADQAFTTMTDLALGELRGLAPAADAWPFRHGGDEFSFVVVARDPGMAADQLLAVVVGALQRLEQRARQALLPYEGIRHTKPGSPSGTGVVWGLSPIGPGADPAQVFATADLQVEHKKLVGSP